MSPGTRTMCAGMGLLLCLLPAPVRADEGTATPLSQEPAQETARADQSDAAALFDEGNRLYQAGDFEGALAAYLRIRDSGLESGDLLYNIGNAYFKLGELGPAILFYERARGALPHDESVRANLELARSLTVDRVTPLPGFWLTSVVRWWVDLVPRGLLIGIVALGYLLAAGGLFLRILGVGSRHLGRGLIVAGGVVTLVFGANLLVRELGLWRPERGVMLASETPVQSAPASDPSLQLFSVHEGTIVRIDRRSEEWLEIVLEDGKVGWVRSDSLETI